MSPYINYIGVAGKSMQKIRVFMPLFIKICRKIMQYSALHSCCNCDNLTARLAKCH